MTPEFWILIAIGGSVAAGGSWYGARRHARSAGRSAAKAAAAARTAVASRRTSPLDEQLAPAPRPRRLSAPAAHQAPPRSRHRANSSTRKSGRNQDFRGWGNTGAVSPDNISTIESTHNHHVGGCDVPSTSHDSGAGSCDSGGFSGGDM